MFVEERIYQLLPGRAAEYLALYQAKGLQVQARYLKTMLGYYSAEIGDLNEVVHLWGHESLDAREENRNSMRADPEFQAYWHEVREIVVAQRCRILRPAPFFVEPLAEMAKISVSDMLAAKG